MHWEDTAPRRAVNFGAAFGVPDDPTPFRVRILRVAEADPLPPAFAEFWRRVLTDGVGECSDRWEVLLFAMNFPGGGFTCVFTNRDLGRDEPPVFKLSSAAIEAECYALPREESQAGRGYLALEEKVFGLLREAVHSGPAAGLVRALRARRAFSVEACDFYRARRRELGA